MSRDFHVVDCGQRGDKRNQDQQEQPKPVRPYVFHDAILRAYPMDCKVVKHERLGDRAVKYSCQPYVDELREGLALR